MKLSKLILENGAVFEGHSPSWQKSSFTGEVVFTTGMTGYPESLTDPSYTGQIITFTFPLIGNFGVPPAEQWESKKIHAAGVVVSETCLHWSHHEGTHSLLEWLEQQNVPIITGVDTRALTKLLRNSGTLLGAIACNPKEKKPKFIDPNAEDLVGKVSIPSKITYGKGAKQIIAVDCGMKENIIRCLAQFPITIQRVPYDYDYSNDSFDGIFISNGPGDPSRCKKTIAILRKALTLKKPIFGICLGSQLMALAAGATTYKLRYGHRGHNQPCINTDTQRCYITSQNHGYAVRKNSIPKGWRVTFRNLNDDSIEGIAHNTLPYFSVQFHPEASPGPTDSQWLFEEFYKCL